MSRAFNSGYSALPVERLKCCTDQHTADHLPRSVSVLQRSSPAETTRLQLLQVFREAQVQKTLEFHKYRLKLPNDFHSDRLSASQTDQEDPSPSKTARPYEERGLCHWPRMTSLEQHREAAEIDFRKYFEETDPDAGRSPNHRIGQAMSPLSFERPKPLRESIESSPTVTQASLVSRTPGSSLIYPAGNGLVSSLSSFHYFPKPQPSPTQARLQAPKPRGDAKERMESNSEAWSQPFSSARDPQCRAIVAAVVKSREGLKYRQGFLLTLRRFCPTSDERPPLLKADQLVLALTRNRKTKIYELDNLSLVDSGQNCMKSLRSHLGESVGDTWSEVPVEFLERCARTLVCYFEEHSMPAVLVFSSRAERDEFVFALQSLLAIVGDRHELTQFIFDGQT